MPLPDSFLQELKERSDIVSIVSSYVNLKRRGRNLVGLCPFHTEKTPSFNLYPENGSFYCFGCGAGGDVITFIRRIENLDYIEAVRFLAERAGLQMPENSQDETLSKLRQRVLEANREAARYYYGMLMAKAGEQALAYLRGRNLSDRTIRHFGLGYAPGTRFALVDYLGHKGFGRDEIVAANLGFVGRSGKLLDRFYDRVMFPIIDVRGNVIAFGGRVMGKGEPKYLNTSDTLVFKKSSNLFALNFAKNDTTNQFILAEGYMDVIALHQAGFTSAVATLGTSLTQEQANLIGRYVPEVVICYDSDAAGQKATARAIPMLRAAGLLVKVLNLPSGKDPDEFIKSHGESGPARFKQALEQSGNDVEYQLQKIKNTCQLDTSEGKVQYLTEAAKVLAGLESRIEQEVYAGRLAEEVQVERSAILYQVEKQQKRKRFEKEKQMVRTLEQKIAPRNDTVNPQRRDNLRVANAEEGLIAYVINHPDAAKTILNQLGADRFVTDFNRRVYQSVTARILEGRGCSLTDLSQDFSADEISAIARMLSNAALGQVGLETALEYIKVIETEHRNQQLKQALEGDAQDVQKYMESLRELKQ